MSVPSLTQRFRLPGTPMIQLAKNVGDSNASTLHANLSGAPGGSQQSRLVTESSLDFYFRADETVWTSDFLSLGM